MSYVSSFQALPPPRRSLRGLGGASAAIAATMGPYAPFSSPSSAGQASGAGGQEGQIASLVLAGILAGSVPTSAVAEQAGAVAGGVAGAGAAGPLGYAVGTVVGGAVGKAVSGLVPSGSDCDAACAADKVHAQLAPQLCVHRQTGQMDAACSDAVYWIARNNFDCAFEVLPPGMGNKSGCQAIVGDWDQPLTFAGLERTYRARLAQQAAKVRLADDVTWAEAVVLDANKTANTWGPQCQGDAACVSQVKANAVQYALNAHPFRADDATVPASVAYTQMIAAMTAATRTGIAAQKAASAQAAAAAAASLDPGASPRKTFVIVGVVSLVTIALLAIVLID